MNKLVEMNVMQAQLVWEEAEAHLRRAINDEDKDEALRLLKGRVFAGMNTLWRVDDEFGKVLAWGTTTLYTGDGVIVTAQISLACTRDMKLFLGNLDEFEVWAHKHGAHYIEVIGRFGWTKVLKPLGFAHNYTSLTKRIFQELH